MPNKNYVKGRRKEYKIVNNLKRSRQRNGNRCEIAFRSAGSHSPIDVVGINISGKKIYLVQAKPDSMSSNARKKLEEEWKELNGTFEVSFEVI